MHQIKKLASCICFMLILGILSGAVSSLMEMKESRERYAEFWQDPTGYDVWFMGSSHVYCSILPMWDPFIQPGCPKQHNPTDLLDPDVRLGVRPAQGCGYGYL